MKARKCLLTLAFCLTASSWASGISDDDRMAAQLALSKRVTEVSGKLQNSYDRWWNDFENGTEKKMENVPAYLNRLAHKGREGAEAAAWLLSGGKYGLCNPALTTQQRADLQSARDTIALEESNALKAGGKGFLHGIRTAFEAGKVVLNDLLDRVDSLEYDNRNLKNRVSFLEKEVAGIPLLIKKETDPLNRKIVTIEDERKADAARLNLRITTLEKENKEFLETINKATKKVEIDTAVEEAKKDLRKAFEKEKTDFEKVLQNQFAEEKKIFQSTIDNFKLIVDGYERKALGDAEALQKRAEDAEKAVEEYKKKEVDRKIAEEKKEAEAKKERENELLKLQLANAENSLKDKIASYNDLSLNVEFLRTTLNTSNARFVQLEERVQEYKKDILARQELLKDLRIKLGDCDVCRSHINSIDKVLIA